MKILNSNRNSTLNDSLYGFTNGIEVDKLLVKQEVQVQKSYLHALNKIGYINDNEQKLAEELLDLFLEQTVSGEYEWKIEDEDVHMNLESFVTQKAGELGKKIHYGRSRNDLIATTLRLFVRDMLFNSERNIRTLILSLCCSADKYKTITVPGITHMQGAQPVLFGHVMMCYAQMFISDLDNIKNSKSVCMKYLPMGSAALAGTHLNTDLKSVANELGFDNPSFNSINAVGDRDFIISALGANSNIAIHLGRICEDIIYWSSSFVGLIKLPHNWSTGSSIMPNKRNPDVLELIRAKVSKILSCEYEAKNILKTLPTSYNSDLHEIKETFVRSSSQVNDCLKIINSFINEMSVDTLTAKKLLNNGHILATEIANHLVEKGMSFRDAYKKTASLVEMADVLNKQVHELTENEYKTVVGELNSAFMISLNFDKAIENRNNLGGTSIEQITKSIAEIRMSLG